MRKGANVAENGHGERGEDIGSCKRVLTGSGMCAVQSDERGLTSWTVRHGSFRRLDPDYRSVERRDNPHRGQL